MKYSISNCKKISRTRFSCLSCSTRDCRKKNAIVYFALCINNFCQVPFDTNDDDSYLTFFYSMIFHSKTTSYIWFICIDSPYYSSRFKWFSYLSLYTNIFIYAFSFLFFFSPEIFSFMNIMHLHTLDFLLRLSATGFDVMFRYLDWNYNDFCMTISRCLKS